MMRTRTTAIAILSLAAAGVVAHGDALAARVLVEQTDITVTTGDQNRCGEPVEVKVRATRPAVYQREATELQRIIDAVRAQLGFECRAIPAIAVSGTLAGMNEEMYYAVAEPRTDWRLIAQRSLRTQPPATPVSAAPPVPTPQPAPTATYLIAGLSVGMSVEEAMVAVKSNLGVDGRYNANRQQLQVRERGCPVDYNWSERRTEPVPGWRCLDASFAAGGNDPWLTEARLAQVVDRDQRNVIIETLISRYGPPAMQYNTPSRSRLAWGTRIDSRNLPDHHTDADWPLSADIDASSARTILLLRLAAATSPPYQFRF
jgi:hypothetical protein